jgi:hypothetical protein
VSRVEDFDSEYWSDPDIEPLSLEASHLYIWSFTNDRIGPAGIYKVTRRGLAESKVPDDRLDAALAELAEHELAFYDGTYLWVKARVKRLRTRTVAMCKGIAKTVAKVPADHPYREQFMARYGGQVWRSGDFATTIAEEVQALDPGTTPVAQGCHPQTSIPKPNSGYHTGESGTHHGKGNGKGKGKGPQGRGPGRGIAPDVAALAAEHFPDHHPDAVLNTILHLERRLIEPTVERIAESLRDAA